MGTTAVVGQAAVVGAVVVGNLVGNIAVVPLDGMLLGDIVMGQATAED